MGGSLAIITACIIGATVYTSYLGFTRLRFIDDLIFSPVRVLRDRQYQRLLTSGFLHANWPHLLFNMFSLYAFGSVIETKFGPHVLMLIYFASIAGGSILSLLLHRHDETYQALGASGGVCGVIFAAIFMLPGQAILVWPLPLPIPAWLYAILFILISFFGMRMRLGNIGHDAHLGGAIIGLAVTTILDPGIVLLSPALYATVVLMTALLALSMYRWPDRLRPDPAKWRRLYRNSRARKVADQHVQDEVFLDQTLGKIAKSGMISLSGRERRRLRAISKRKNREASREPEKTTSAGTKGYVENLQSKD